MSKLGLVLKLHLFVLLQQNDHSSQEHKTNKRFIQLIVACCNSPKPFDLLKETLDQMAFLVSIPVT